MGYIEYDTVWGSTYHLVYDNNTRFISMGGKQIKKIKIVDCPLIQELYLDCNQINQINQIEGLDNLTFLQTIHLGNNYIHKIEGLEKLTSLRNLYLSCNFIRKIEGLEHLTSLQNLCLNNTLIRKIEGLDNLIALKYLSLEDNLIEKIEGIENLITLTELSLHGNRIAEVPLIIMNCRNLVNLYVDCPINQIIDRFMLKNRWHHNKTIYDDKQNVHNSHIAQSIKDSLYSLMDEKTILSDDQTVQEIIIDPILTQQVKEQIVEYCRCADVHSVLNVTFMEALQIVWQTIRSHEHSVEIKKIMNQEIDDSYCKCFTGRLSRLTNCLNGFDPRVSVKISNDQEITNLIITIRQKTERLEDQIILVRKELSDRGYDQQTIEQWIGYLE
jgi:hypothetical protein